MTHLEAKEKASDLQRYVGNQIEIEGVTYDKVNAILAAPFDNTVEFLCDYFNYDFANFFEKQYAQLDFDTLFIVQDKNTIKWYWSNDILQV